jgi:hypothetical protein
MGILHSAAAHEALYDSAESFPQPKCHPETRTRILDDLYTWAIGTDSSHSIVWLYGPAGAGKSAIMQSLCQRLQDSRHLGGSFFFKRGDTIRASAKALFVTLAYQLTLGSSALRGLISKRVKQEPLVVRRSLSVQLRELIIQPYKSLENPIIPLLLIDGLDECDSQELQQEVLQLLSNAVLDNPSMLRIIIASRPEPHIRELFDRPSAKPLYRAFNIKQSFEDVEKYLRHEFSRIHSEHRDTMGGIPTPWPSDHILEILVQKSSGYFVYAATIIKFIDDRDFCPTDRLVAVVRSQNLPDDCDRPFEALDQLYKQILSTVPARTRLIRILTAIANFKLSRDDIALLLDLDSAHVGLSLRRLHSILEVPSYDSEHSDISVYHESFRDFLNDPNRSDEFSVGTSNRRMELARSVLSVFSYMEEDSATKRVLPSSRQFAWYVYIFQDRLV